MTVDLDESEAERIRWDEKRNILEKKVSQTVLELLHHTGADGFDHEISDNGDIFNISIMNKELLSSETL